jgi:hypothetical protein
MSQATHDLIPIKDLLTEFSSAKKLIVASTITQLTIYEGNKLHPRTKHICLKYHHFHSHILNGSIKIQWIDTKHQSAEIFTKPLYFFF